MRHVTPQRRMSPRGDQNSWNVPGKRHRDSWNVSDRVLTKAQPGLQAGCRSVFMLKVRYPRQALETRALGWLRCQKAKVPMLGLAHSGLPPLAQEKQFLAQEAGVDPL